MKEPLTNCIIAITGDFGATRSITALKKWIEVNGGKVAKAVSSKTTHLICSKENWKRQVSTGKMSPTVKTRALTQDWSDNPYCPVRAAQKHKSIKIVSYDWLEDSLHHRTCRGPRKYLWSVIAKDEKIRKQEQRSEQERKLKQAGKFCFAGFSRNHGFLGGVALYLLVRNEQW